MLVLIVVILKLVHDYNTKKSEKSRPIAVSNNRKFNKKPKKSSQAFVPVMIFRISDQTSRISNISPIECIT